MEKLAKLRQAKALSDVAALLEVQPQTLSFALYKMPLEARYSVFEIPKRSGGFRVISAPAANIRNLQSKLADILNDILDHLEANRAKENCILSHGFKRGYSIQTNARFHRNKRFVFNADLKDFFPSVNFGRVRGFFCKDRNFELNPNVATILAQIACYKNELPQGSPCSPVISNLVTHILDIQLNRLAKANRCSYTRYADDLTFSSNEKIFSESIARKVRGSDDKWVAGYELVACISRAGFSVNEYKTRMQYRESRQDVTGLVVNKKVNVRREYYEHVRQLAHHLYSHGYCYNNSSNEFRILSENALNGMFCFIDHVKRNEHTESKENKGFKELYKRFLDYRSFHGLSRPRIMCEGKTDSIYIKAACKALAKKFPTMVDLSRRDPVLMDFFGFSERAERFQKLTGGGDQLNGLIRDYRRRTSKFRTVPQFPVVMIVDNDSGSENLFKYVESILGTKVDGSAPFYHVFSNVYVVPIPKLGKATAAIEDLFEKGVLEEKLDGRSFDRTNKKKDGSKWYGKNELATKIVRPKSASINFDNFEPLLKAIVDATTDYSSRI